MLYLQGRGVSRDTAEAARLFERAAKNGSLAGEVEHAILLFNGDGVPANEALAARLSAAPPRGATPSRRTGLPASTPRDAACRKNRVEAAAWHMIAAAQGLTDAWLDTL